MPPKFQRGPGASGFDDKYWEEYYSEPEEMDGMANAHLHARYLKSLMDLEMADVSSVIDFGFGLGELFKAIVKEFKPYRVQGIEPSDYAFNKVTKKKLNVVAGTKLKLVQTDLVSWCRDNSVSEKWFDLGICTSVFQYLSDEEIKYVLPILSRSVKYLYFSVPTDRELRYQVSDLEFHDKNAIRRGRTKYLKMLSPHFTVVGSRLLESKFHFKKDEDSPFSDFLFRF
ncbi:MAG: class I SAM-dependent methyltransferase [Deltaproteobacteria bacterium]|nr:MAG: class I SAM-dependent methyltransferase [Deltaproteobacteria bacterium]TNF26368.1 MAG: class I SAM-dependent methyltransferase [Deltaproteobacteria bacterium]